MKEVHDLAVSFDEAIAAYEEAVRSAKRQWSARLLRHFPGQALLGEEAEQLRQELNAAGVAVHSLGDGRQVVLAKSLAPECPVLPDDIAERDSLCVLTIGAEEPLQASDIQGDPFLENHFMHEGQLQSWASAPVFIQGVSAGTVCAVEVEHPRKWTEGEQKTLESAARRVSEFVEQWLASSTKSAAFLS